MKVGDQVIPLQSGGIGNYIWTVLSIEKEGNEEKYTVQSFSDKKREMSLTKENLVSITDPNLVDILEPIEGHFYKRSLSYRLARLEKAVGIKNE